MLLKDGDWHYSRDVFKDYGFALNISNDHLPTVTR